MCVCVLEREGRFEVMMTHESRLVYGSGSLQDMPGLELIQSHHGELSGHLINR